MVVSRFLRLGSNFRQRLNGVRTVLPFSSQPTRPKYVTLSGVSLELLTKAHDVSKIRQLLVEGFVLNNEPVIQCLCERHYPTLSINQRLLQVEKKYQDLYPEWALTEKIEEGLSTVVIKDSGNPAKYLSVMFAETYKGYAYHVSNNSTSNDRFCSEALGLMEAVHKKAAPFLSRHNPEKIAFLSRAATLPEYRSMGILEANMDFMCSRLAAKGFKLAYCLSTTERNSRFIEKRFNFHAIGIAEVMYKDYVHRESGEKVFQNVAENCPSIKAMVKFL